MSIINHFNTIPANGTYEQCWYRTQFEDGTIEVRAMRATREDLSWATPPVWTEETDFSGQLSNGDTPVWDTVTDFLNDRDPEEAAAEILARMTGDAGDDARVQAMRELRKFVDAVMASDEETLSWVERFDGENPGLDFSDCTWVYGDGLYVDLDDVDATNQERAAVEAWAAENL